MTDATEHRAAIIPDALEELRDVLWQLWRRGYFDLDDLRRVGGGRIADQMERAAHGD